MKLFLFFLIGMEEEKLFNYQWEKTLVKLIKKNWEKMLVKALNRGALNMHKKLLLSVDKVWCLLHFVYQLSNGPLLCILDFWKHGVAYWKIDIKQIWVEKWGKGNQGLSHPQRSEWTSWILSSVAPSATMELALNVVCK